MKRKDYALLDWRQRTWWNLGRGLTRGRGRASHDGAMVAVGFGYRGDESLVEKKEIYSLKRNDEVAQRCGSEDKVDKVLLGVDVGLLEAATTMISGMAKGSIRLDCY